MIILVNGNEQADYAYLTNKMFRIRAKVFHERLKWDVNVVDGLEKDHFDQENPLYLISVDEVSGNVRGSLRLLPTTGPNMLRDVFPILLPPGEVVESATIWESSRFSMEPGAETPEPGRLLSRRSGAARWSHRSCFGFRCANGSNLSKRGLPGFDHRTAATDW